MPAIPALFLRTNRQIRLVVADFGVSRQDFEAALPKLIEYAEQDTQFFTAPRIPGSEELAQMFEYIYEGKAIDF